MSLSFKNYLEFIDLPEDATDEQINEIFGLFRNNDKLEKLKAERERLKKTQAERDAAWKAARAKAMGKTQDDKDKDKDKERDKSGSAAASRRDELQWRAQFEAVEGLGIGDVVKFKEPKNHEGRKYGRVSGFKLEKGSGSKVQKLMVKATTGAKKDLNYADPEYDVDMKDVEKVNSRGDDYPVYEATNHLGETEYRTYGAWRRAAKKANPQVWFEGDEDIAQAMVGPQPYKKGETHSIGEWDGEVGVIYKVTEAAGSASKLCKEYCIWANDKKLDPQSRVTFMKFAREKDLTPAMRDDLEAEMNIGSKSTTNESKSDTNYEVVWTDREYKTNRKTFKSTALGSPDEAERKARAFAKALEAKEDVRSVRVQAASMTNEAQEDVPSIGFENKKNSQAAKRAFTKAGIKFETDSNMGIDYFYFKTKTEMKAAIKLARTVIDPELESEWS